MSTDAGRDGVPEDGGRRVFLITTAACTAGVACFGCSRLAAAAGTHTRSGQDRPKAALGKAADPFAADGRMTFREVYAFAYAQNLIPIMKLLAEDIGHDKLVATLQAALSRAAAEQMKKMAPPPPKNTLSAYLGLTDDTDYFWSHVLEKNWTEKKETAAEIRVTRCLWAETFRAAGAADIGYAAICHGDFAAASAFNPKIRLFRTKTLMQGHDCCNHRWVQEA
jgi:hypothetical protein